MEQKGKYFFSRTESIPCEQTVDNVSVYVKVIQILCSNFVQYLASRKRQRVKVRETLTDKPQTAPRISGFLFLVCEISCYQDHVTCGQLEEFADELN